MMVSNPVVTTSLFIVYIALVSAQAPRFHDGVSHGIIHNVNEASGLAASRKHADLLYTHNDSGGHPRIFAISANDASIKATITISGAHNHDWEDIACGPCPNKVDTCIYIGDIGGNVHGATNNIYMITEPDSVHDQTVHVKDTLHFTWGEHNAETLMVDPDANLYLVSKVHNSHGKVFRISSTAWAQSSISLNGGQYINLHTDHVDPVGGDINPKGHGILIKTHAGVWYYHAPDNDYVHALVHTSPVKLPYHMEGQGEAVCWDRFGHDYYTTSEGHNRPLYFYQHQ